MKEMGSEELKSLLQVLKPTRKRVGFTGEEGLLLGLKYYSNGAWAILADYAPKYVTKAERNLVDEEDSKTKVLNDKYFTDEWRGLLSFRVYNEVHITADGRPIVLLATVDGGNEMWVNGYFLAMFIQAVGLSKFMEIRSAGGANPVYVVDRAKDRMVGVLMPIRGYDRD